jgi:hypothetical protein
MKIDEGGYTKTKKDFFNKFKSYCYSYGLCS